MNFAAFTGRLGQDVELRSTQSGKSVANISLAVKRNFNKEETDWFRCTAWGKTAETMAEYLHKGSKILVEGEIRVDEYEKDGQKRKSTELIISRFEFLDNKNQENNQQQGNYQNQGQYGNQQQGNQQRNYQNNNQQRGNQQPGNQQQGNQQRNYQNNNPQQGNQQRGNQQGGLQNNQQQGNYQNNNPQQGNQQQGNYQNNNQQQGNTGGNLNEDFPF